tara:strand:+ start:221 stop:394 length:174 start_codon:yes stop_codon:yes gene_type:complete
MTTSFNRQRISITLDLEVYDDFDARDIDFHALLDLEGDENVSTQIRDHSEFMLDYNI